MAKKQLGTKDSAKTLRRAQPSAREQKTKSATTTKAGSKKLTGKASSAPESVVDNINNADPVNGAGGVAPAVDHPNDGSPLPAGGAPGTPATADGSDGFLTSAPPTKIHPSPFQHRTVFNKQEMDELRKDISKNGIHTPLLVRKHPTLDGEFELVTGERRLRTSLDLTMPQVPIIVRPLSDRQVKEIQWSENFRRINPDPVDEAHSLHGMLPYHRSADSLAGFLGKPRSYVRARLRLLDLIEPIQEIVHARAFNLNEALEIATIDEEAQKSFYEKHCSKWKERQVFQLPNLRQLLEVYKTALTRAIFDTNASDVIPGVKSCTECPWNSANHKVLFPDADNAPVCGKHDCFQEKTKAQMRKDLATLIEEQHPTAIVHRGDLLEVWDDLFAERPEMASWPRHRMREVSLFAGYIKPLRDRFPSDESFQEAWEDYDNSNAELDKALQAGTVVRTLLIQDYKITTALIDFRPTPSVTQAVESVTLKSVEEHIKAGTVTAEMIDKAIERVRERDKASEQRENESRQELIHAAYMNQVDEVRDNTTLTDADLVGLRLFAYLALEVRGRQVFEELVAFKEHNNDGSPQTLFQWLGSLKESELAYMIRLVYARRGDCARPGSYTAETMTLIAKAIGVDVASIEASIEKKKEERVKTRDRRIQLLEFEKQKLSNKE